MPTEDVVLGVSERNHFEANSEAAVLRKQVSELYPVGLEDAEAALKLGAELWVPSLGCLLLFRVLGNDGRKGW